MDRKERIEKEKKLVKEAKKNVSAFGELYDLYFDDIYLFIAYKIGSKHDAEDLTALTFEKAMTKIGGFEWKGYTFGSWLYTIARNTVLDEYKKKKITLSVEEVVTYTADDEVESLSEQTDRKIQTVRLMKTVGLLPEDQQEVIYFRYIKELNIKETMKITGRTIDSVKSLSKRGLKKLKELMRESDKILDPDFFGTEVET